MDPGDIEYLALQSTFYLFYFIYIFIYLFMAVSSLTFNEVRLVKKLLTDFKGIGVGSIPRVYYENWTSKH